MLAQSYIHKLILKGQQTIEYINKNDHDITVLDIQRSLGKLDEVLFNLEAAQCLLREELKVKRGDYDETN